MKLDIYELEEKIIVEIKGAEAGSDEIDFLLSDGSHCERCNKSLLNPHSILLHQGGFCRKRIENATDLNLDQIVQLLRKLNIQ